jgi:hypothetical protein
MNIILFSIWKNIDFSIIVFSIMRLRLYKNTYILQDIGIFENYYSINFIQKISNYLIIYLDKLSV